MDHCVVMQKRILIFSLLFFLGGHLASLKAMPPMMHGEVDSSGKQEKQGGHDDLAEKNRRATDLQQNNNQNDNSSLFQCGNEIKAGEKMLDEEGNFSDEELDEILSQATEVQKYWEDIHTDVTTTPTMFQGLVEKLEEEEDVWEKRQEQLNAFAEKAQSEDTKKLKQVITACDETLILLREQEFQLLLEKQRSYSDDNLTSSSDQQTNPLITAMKGVSLKDTKSSSSSSSHDHSVFSNNANNVSSSELQKRILDLSQQAVFLRKRAQQCGECAHKEHRHAKNSFIKGLLIQAEYYYQDAVESALKTARAWEKSEQVHLELMRTSETKVRQWGQRLKITWEERANDWAKEWKQLIQEVEKNKKILEEKKEAKRQQKIIALQQRINEAQAKKEEALQQGILADQEERNEIGNTWSVISKKYQGIIRHLSKAKTEYEQHHDSLALESEKKALLFHQSLNELQLHVQFLISEMQEWKQKGGKPYCLENDATKNKSIWRERFIGPLIRKEKRQDSSGEKEVEMAGDYLNIKLKEGQTPDLFLELLKESFPNCDLKMEVISQGSLLYALHFKPASNCSDPFPWLNTMDAIQKKIAEEQLALRCYPDVRFKLASDVATSGIPICQITEPWSLHATPPIGINPPENLFSAINPVIPTPKDPVLVAVLDTGVHITHQALQYKDQPLENKIIFFPDESWEVDKDSSFGYDATTSEKLMSGYPNDVFGHGTHIAGIIAGRPHQVTHFEKLLNNNNSNSNNNNNQSDGFEKKILNPAACIQGVASMPGMVKLLICKIANGKDVLPKHAIKGIEFARQQNARILNCSWGIPPEKFTKDDFYEMAAKLSNEYYPLPGKKALPIAIVASAGNDGKCIDASSTSGATATTNADKPIYPISLGLDNLISVGWTNKKGERAVVIQRTKSAYWWFKLWNFKCSCNGSRDSNYFSILYWR